MRRQWRPRAARRFFASLREKGIKAIKVVAADGSKANGEVRGYRLRTVIVIGGVAAVLGFLLELVF